MELRAARRAPYIVLSCGLSLVGCGHAHERGSPSADGDAGLALDAAASADAARLVDAAAARDAAPPSSCAVANGPAFSFSSAEVLVSTSPVCAADEACVVFHLRGNPACVEGTGSCSACATGASSCVVHSSQPETESRAIERVFCACHCGPGSGIAGTSFCACGAGSVCMPEGDPGGGMCVPRALAAAYGVCSADADCRRGHCDATGHCA